MKFIVAGIVMLLFSSAMLGIIPSTPLTNPNTPLSSGKSKQLHELNDTELYVVKDFITHIYSVVTRQMDCIPFNTVFETIVVEGRPMDGIYALPSWACTEDSILTPGVLDALRLYALKHVAEWRDVDGNSGQLYIKQLYILHQPGVATNKTGGVYQDGITLIPQAIRIVQD